jgi:hypothetical protein
MNRDNYFRCAFIVRGRGQDKIDELLPIWASIVSKHSTKTEWEFNKKVDAELVRIAGGVTEKTAANYRTETLGKILGLYYTSTDGKVFASKRAETLLTTGDQFQFFKDLVCKMQVPSGISKNAKHFIDKKISFMPSAFILICLEEAENAGLGFLSKQEVFWYILSNLNVLQGRLKPKDLVKEISVGRRKWKYKKYLEGSRETQHANEMINLLKYANLIKVSGKNGAITINSNEKDDIRRIIKYAEPGLGFQSYDYALSNPGDFKKFEQDWEKYFSAPCFSDIKIFSTNYDKNFGKVEIEAFDDEDVSEVFDVSTKEIGDTGERYVFNCERKIVRRKMPQEYRRVHLLSYIKGIGFDVQSVRLDNGPDKDDYIYIEVKTTPRATKPSNLCHLANLTENEYKAARQHGDNYYVYKVYLTPEGTFVFKLQNPYKARDGQPGITKDGNSFRVNSSALHWTEAKYEAV